MSEHRERDIQSFDMSYMNWIDFKMIACSPSNHSEGWNLLASMDCIIGGLDYTIGTRCVLVSTVSCTVEIALLRLSYSMLDRSDYDLDPNELRRFEARMRLLSSEVSFWPPIPQVQMAGYKQDTITLLDGIATTHSWKRPCTRVIHDGELIPTNGVLKRTHSDCGSHVLLPEESVPHDAVDAVPRKMELSARRTWDSINDLTTSMDQSWICQDYIPTLLKLGEWRFFIVGEQIVNVVHTLKDTASDSDAWSGRPVVSFYTKAEIR